MNQELSKEIIRQAHIHARSATTLLMESCTTDNPVDIERVRIAANWLRQALELLEPKAATAEYLGL